MADAEPTPVHAPRNPDLPQRVGTAIAMLAVTGFALWRGGWVLDGLVLVIGLVTFWEWQRLVFRWHAQPLDRLGWVLVGVLYIGLATALLIAMHAVLVVLVVGVTALTDTGAYFAGRTFGGPKIAPRISPSKTWAGLYGGMAGAALFLGAVGWLASLSAQAQLTREAEWPMALMVAGFACAGMALAMAAQAGDFFESWLKRRAGVKDSSRILPGHGGVFDRVDGMIPVAIIVGIVARMTGMGE